MVDLELYRIFKIVAEEANITRASERLNISQPAVTKRIKNLESLLNTKLFDRSNKGLKLTEQGEKIYKEINNSINTLEKIEMKYGSAKTINLGTHITVFNKVLGKNLAKFKQENKAVKINIDRSDLDELFIKLEKQEIDIIVSKREISYNNENIQFVKLTELQDILIINSNYNTFDKKVSLQDLIGKTIYLPRKSSITTKNFFEAIKDLPSNSVNFNNINYRTMLEMLNYDDSIGLVTKEIVTDLLEAKTFTELKTTFKIKPVEYGIYVNKNNKFKELNSFVKILSENLS